MSGNKLWTWRWPSKDELYGLTSQARRAAVSICANIAEGYGREMRPSYIQFLRIAQGSIKELETHLIIAQRVELSAAGKIDDVLAQCESVGKLLRLLVRKLEGESA
ncbi:MAG TPA: four helix bundle protein [Vitreimonas sp.]|nr:four helix bundle protein [Vitreimonas sp.]HYD87995.1 four helix bundle protein [Vitreimonas sp.]